MSENVNHPAHYQGRFECIDEMVALFGVEAVVNFCRLNAYKYRFRAVRKGGEEDIKKAEWYVAKAAELLGLDLPDQEELARQADLEAKAAAQPLAGCESCKHGPNIGQGPCRYCFFQSKYVRRDDHDDE